MRLSGLTALHPPHPLPMSTSYNTILGTDTANTLVGTSGADSISALAGNDFINGKGGSDILYGGDGNDSVQTAAAIDSALLNGNGGNDQLSLTVSYAGSTLRGEPVDTIRPPSACHQCSAAW